MNNIVSSYASQLVSILLLCFLSVNCTQNSFQSQNQVCFKNKCIDVEVALTPKELTEGLKFRKSLDKNSGMLFVFSDNRKHSFWMKDTQIPLDMIWLDYTRKIVHMEYNVSPCLNDPCPSYSPDTSALYVLEVNAHYAKTLGLKEGDQATFNLNNI